MIKSQILGTVDQFSCMASASGGRLNLLGAYTNARQSAA